MRSETELVALLERCKSGSAAEPIARRRRTVNPAFDTFVVEERIAQEDPNNDTELRRSRRSGSSLKKGVGLQRRGVGPLLVEGWLRLRRGPLHSGWEQQLMQTRCRRPVQNCW
ncbi:unnamed protein product [Arctogadus glacialis]